MREVAAAAHARGDATGWFDALYREAQAGSAVVPWDDRLPNAFLVDWLDHHPQTGRALEVGCGMGDNARELARRGLAVTAFDVSPTAIAAARRRHPGLGIDFTTANLVAPPAAWRGAFDLVVEIYTLQALPADTRARAALILPPLLAPGGTLLVIARMREPDESPGELPWPLLRSELEAIAIDGVSLTDLRIIQDGETRRWLATFHAAP
jgi:SAM-dependent methyltransferase